jgi:nitrogen fixation NifU-like protein
MNDELYQKAILGKAREAIGAGSLEDADARVTVDNPVCGDRVTLELRMEDGHVGAVAHKVRGCLLCEAAASVIGANAPGSTAEEIAAAREAVTALVKDGAEIPADSWSDLAIFHPVTEHKSRHYCVLLPFEALDKALAEAGAS